MYLYGPTEQNLGFDPFSAILTGSALKSVLGIGKKKAAMKDNIAANVGYYTSQFPPYTSFDNILSIGAQSALGKKAGAASMKAEYEIMQKRNDSILVKNKIASPEDYAAYTVLQWLDMDIGCDPKQRDPGHKWYKHCPVHKESGINIFDAPRLDAWMAKQQKPLSQPMQKAPPLAKQPSAAPSSQPAALHPASFGAQGSSNNALTDFFKNLTANMQQPAAPQFMPQTPVTAPVQKETPEWLIPVAIGAVVLGAGYVMTRKKRRGRR